MEWFLPFAVLSDEAVEIIRIPDSTQTKDFIIFFRH
jgi:hypothetical protein